MMNSDMFKTWLAGKGLGRGTVASVCSRVVRIEEAYDLAVEYSQDRCATLLEELTYTAQDAKRGLLPKASITINGSYVDGFRSLKQALLYYVEYLDQTKPAAPAKRKTGVCFYEGNFADLKTYIGPKCRNIIQAITRAKKNAVVGCECCGAHKTLEAAHRHGFERNDVIKRILDKDYAIGQDLYKVDLVEFEQTFKEAHNPPEDVFFFLCKACHNRYDGKDKQKAQDVVDAVLANRSAKAALGL